MDEDDEMPFYYFPNLVRLHLGGGVADDEEEE